MAACVVLSGIQSLAIEPGATDATKPDWARLQGLLAAGDYVAAAAVADEIATARKPKRREPDFLPRSIDHVRALMKRGYAELKLGRLDDAAETLEKAYRSLKDPEVKRLVSIDARGGKSNTLLLLDADLLELLDLRMALILERLRFANLARDAGDELAADRIAEFHTQVRGWLDEFATLEKSAKGIRKSLAEGLDKGGQAMLASPYYRALTGQFRPALFAGIKSLELSRLPGDESQTSGGDPAAPAEPDPRHARLEEALRLFGEATTALDEAIAAAAPKGLAGSRAEARIEAALMRVELLTCEGAALLESGQPTRGRECLAKALELRQEAGVLAKLPRPDSHPEIFSPLLLSAVAMLDEARAELAAGDFAQARTSVRAAAKFLARADALPVPEGNPLRSRLAIVRARLEKDDRAVATAIPGMDAADAAARRLRRAIDATAAAGAGLGP